MKKLKLNLDEIKVESFEVTNPIKGNGTIFGAASEERCESAGLCGTGTGGNPSTDPNAIECGGGGGFIPHSLGGLLELTICATETPLTLHTVVAATCPTCPVYFCQSQGCPPYSQVYNCTKNDLC